MLETAKHPRPFIVPVFLPHAGCPHRCLFCNQETITGAPSLPSREALTARIASFLAYRRHPHQEVQIAFYGGNFLGLAPSYCRELLHLAQEFVRRGQVHGIRFSTRPDTVTPATLEMLQPFPVKMVEIGAQSMNDDVLAQARRGHTAADTVRAVSLLKARRLPVGLQLMLGLPGDSEKAALASGRKAAAIHPDAVRLYPTVVLAGSPLAALHRRGRYAPLSLEAAVSITKKLYLLFGRRSIPVIRMGLQPTTDLRPGETVLAGPYHPAFGHLVLAEIMLDKAAALLASRPASFGKVTLSVHPASLSRMQGQNRRNLSILRRRFRLEDVRIRTDPSLPPLEVTLEGER